MGLDQLGVLTAGLPVPKEGEHTLVNHTLLALLPWSWLATIHRWLPKDHCSRARPMEHVVNKAHTPGWLQT